MSAMHQMLFEKKLQPIDNSSKNFKKMSQVKMLMLMLMSSLLSTPIRSLLCDDDDVDDDVDDNDDNNFDEDAANELRSDRVTEFFDCRRRSRFFSSSLEST